MAVARSVTVAVVADVVERVVVGMVAGVKAARATGERVVVVAWAVMAGVKAVAR